MPVRFITLAFLLTLTGCSLSTRAACDRSCLTGFLNQYMNALVAHNPDALSVSRRVRFTENRVAMPLGQGLWKTITKLTGYHMDILDVRNRTAIRFAVVEEHGSRSMFALRLKVRRKITEVETMVVRNKAEGMIFHPENLRQASPAMLLKPAPGQLNTRAQMIKIATRYPKGLKAGSFVTADVPFTRDAYRFENGQLMAGPGCTFFPNCSDIKKQRIPTLAGITWKVGAVDEQLGIVLLRMNFGPGATFDGKNTLDVWEAFKVYGSHIHAVEAFMEVMPIGASSGWD